MIQPLRTAAAVALAATAATAQFSVVIPAGCDVAPGISSNAFPWGSSASAWPGLRLMCVYDASNFTSQNVPGPILINRLRWRPDNNAPVVTGGTFATADVRLSTAPIDYTGITTNFATNHGPDLTTVYSGPVVHTPTPGSAAWTVTSWCVDIQLTTPFLYDPTAGDLVIDCDYPTGSFGGGTVGQMDVQSTGSNAGRIWASANYPNANGTALNHGVVVDVGYTPPSGWGYALPIGRGCGAEYRSFYENMTAFDLSNTSLQMNFVGGNYVAVAGTTPVATQSTAPTPFFDDEVRSFALGWSLPYPGGSTTTISVSSNGFVHLGTNTNTGCCLFNPLTFFNGGSPCLAAKWANLNPAAGGTVQFTNDVVNGVAYVTFTNVAETNSAGTNTFQYVFQQNGTLEVRWGSCAPTAGAAGFTTGVQASTPPQIDLSNTPVIVTGSVDRAAVTHAASARPVLGTAIGLDTTSLPAGAPLGATLLGLAELSPPLDLSGLGMTNCSQYGTIDASQVWVAVGGTGSTAFGLPANPAFAGLVLISQAAVLAPGLNPTGALTSNGLRLVLDVN
jgi:hypothetical protein